MQIIEGQCCGRCVKTKCKFNGALYAVGETWKSPDDCVMFECVEGVSFKSLLFSVQRILPEIESITDIIIQFWCESIHDDVDGIFCYTIGNHLCQSFPSSNNYIIVVYTPESLPVVNIEVVVHQLTTLRI